MENLNFLLNYINMVVLGICLCVGFALKNAKIFEKVGNQYIPLIMLILGTAINLLVNQNITAEIILGGMVSGLASTGLYEMFRNLIDKKGGE